MGHIKIVLVYNLELSMTSIITELVYIYLFRSQVKDASGCRSFLLEDLLVTFRRVCSMVGLLSLWPIPHFHSQFYSTCTRNFITSVVEKFLFKVAEFEIVSFIWKLFHRKMLFNLKWLKCKLWWVYHMATLNINLSFFCQSFL